MGGAAPAPALPARRGLLDAQPYFSRITQFFHSSCKLLLGAGVHKVGSNRPSVGG